MPKKTRHQKLRNQIRENELSQRVRVGVISPELILGDSLIKKDLLKSIFFAVGITVFEIALYFIYYLRVFERR